VIANSACAEDKPYIFSNTVRNGGPISFFSTSSFGVVKFTFGNVYLYPFNIPTSGLEIVPSKSKIRCCMIVYYKAFIAQNIVKILKSRKAV